MNIELNMKKSEGCLCQIRSKLDEANDVYKEKLGKYVSIVGRLRYMYASGRTLS